MMVARYQVQREGGMILVAVLWIVAALAIMVTGMTQIVRTETRQASSARQLVVAGARGDAAIHIALQSFVASKEPLSRLTVERVTYQQQSIDVQILPLSGLIDLNVASEALLTRLFVVAGGVASNEAIGLAKAASEWRSIRGGSDIPRGFEASEDLLRVQGIDYDLYARIAPLVTADITGSGRVNPMAAPEGVLSVLADGNAAQAMRIASERKAGNVAIDTTSLTGEFIDSASTSRFQFQARVPLTDGRWVLLSRSVEFLTTSHEGLPWRTFRVERRLESGEGANSI